MSPKVWNFCKKLTFLMSKNEYWRLKHGISLLKLKTKNRSKLASLVLVSLLNKTLIAFSTFLWWGRWKKLVAFQLLPKCSTFASGANWYDNFSKNSPTLLNTHLENLLAPGHPSVQSPHLPSMTVPFLWILVAHQTAPSAASFDVHWSYRTPS